MIKVRELGATRGKKAILHDMSLEIDGGVTGLVAPNGSGKTTLLESLAKPWDRRVTGSVLLDGSAPTATLWEREVFYLPCANEVLEPSLTGRQHAELAKKFWGSTANVERIAESCGASSLLDVPARKCSQGTRQLAALVVALCTDARLLLLDEPFSALDPTNTAQATNVLRKYANAGHAVLMSTHNLTNVDTACDEVLYLIDGTLATANELNQAGRPCLEVYQALYRSI